MTTLPDFALADVAGQRNAGGALDVERSGAT
jgi:hypothetical protein